jgi:general stress protein 26
MQNDAQSRNDSIKKLGELIKENKFAMLTTIHEDGSLRSRPMATQQVEFDGDLWFFTGHSTSKIHELQQHQQVNVSYANVDDNEYVSVSGAASVVRDREKIRELWNPVYTAWFPDGLEDPDLCLLKVEGQGAEYWDAPNSKVVQLVGFVKAMVTGERYEPGDNKQVELKSKDPAA